MNRIKILFFAIFATYCYPLFSQYDSLLLQYDVLHTIAGSGTVDDDFVNSWQESYEGIDATEAELSRPHNAMADLAGNIYITDKNAHSIRKIDRNGKISTVAGINIAGDSDDTIAIHAALNSPNGLWVKSNGEFFILDLMNSKVKKVNGDGKLQTVFKDSSGITVGRGLWVNENEDSIYYTNGNSLKLWTKNNGIKTIDNSFEEPGNIMVSPHGKLTITDKGANLVYTMNKDGHEKQIIAGNGSMVGGGHGFPAIETGLEAVRAIWYLPDGSFLLATHAGSQVWYVDLTGIIHLILDGLKDDDVHSGDGQYFRSPGYKVSEVRYVSMDYDGNILVVENDRGFVRKIEKKRPVAIQKLNDLLLMSIRHDPADNKLIIQLPEKSTTIHPIFLYNEMGQLVIKKDCAKLSDGTLILPSANLPNGFYIVKVYCTYGLFSGKCMIRH